MTRDRAKIGVTLFKPSPCPSPKRRGDAAALTFVYKTVQRSGKNNLPLLSGEGRGEGLTEDTMATERKRLSSVPLARPRTKVRIRGREGEGRGEGSKILSKFAQPPKANSNH
jgi:hypothetical protein